MAIERSTGETPIQFINFAQPTDAQIAEMTECDAFDSMRRQAVSLPGAEIKCGDCPLSGEFDVTTGQLFVEGLCERATS